MRMLLTLVSLALAQALPSAGEAVTISVRVVDEGGVPCAGLPVSLVWVLTQQGEPSGISEHLDHYLDTQVSDAAGEVRFMHAEQAIHPARMIRHVVRLSIPQAERHDVIIPTDPLRSVALTLVEPATGRVVFVVPGSDGATVHLRAVPAGEQDAIPNPDDPCRAPVVDGEAVFAHVGVGTSLAYEVHVSGRRAAPSGKLEGPKTGGAAVRHVVPGAADVPLLVGRIVDESHRPVSDVKLNGSIAIRKGGFSWRGHEVVPDVDGRIAVPVFETWEAGSTVLVHIDAAYWDCASRKRLGHASAVRRLPTDLGKGAFDLGEVVLEQPGSNSVLEPLDDDALERAYHERQEIAYSNGLFRGLVETCLLEMARRGGPRWQDFLARELERISAADTSDQRRVNEGDPLECLIALRRAQRQPDPLTIEIAGNLKWFSAKLPSGPIVGVALVNASEAPFEITESGQLGPRRSSRIHADVIGPDGLPVMPPRDERVIGGGASMRRAFAPGERIEFKVPLASYVRFSAPGDYRVRLQYHDHYDITNDATGRGRLTAASPWFTVHIGADQTHLARAQVESVREWVRAIDVSKPAVIVEETWRHGMAFTGLPESPEDRIFRTGWSAVPVLIEELAATADAARRAWIFALLYDVTGLLEPAGDPYFDAIGNCQWLMRWPMANGRRENELGHQGREPSASAQAALAARWQELEPDLPFTIER